jgi:hypothetical protein
MEVSIFNYFTRLFPFYECTKSGMVISGMLRWHVCNFNTLSLNVKWLLFPRLDPDLPIRFSKSPLNHPAMPPPHNRHKQNPRRPSVLFSSVSRYKPGLWYGLASGITDKDPANPTSQLPQHPTILPSFTSVCSHIQQQYLTTSPYAFVVAYWDPSYIHCTWQTFLNPQIQP